MYMSKDGLGVLVPIFIKALSSYCNGNTVEVEKWREDL